MSTHSMPTAVYVPKLPGSPKNSRFIRHNRNRNITIKETEPPSSPSSGSNNKSEENSSIVKLIVATFILFVVSIFLLIYFFHPSDPEFTLTDATVHAFNFSMHHSLLSSQMQVTLSSRNRNKHFRITYENLVVYADYKSQQITFSTLLPPTSQGQKGSDVWSPYLSGFDVPVAPYFGEELEKDENDGFLSLAVMAEGKVKYKLWIFSYNGRLSVNCPAYFTFGRDGLSSGAVGVIRFQQAAECNTDATL